MDAFGSLAIIPQMQGEPIATTSFSGWIERPVELEAPLKGTDECEVAVIGGGYTGMTAALRLAELGVEVTLVESAFCGWGASSRNAGHLTPTIAGDPLLLATLYRRRASELIHFADAAARHVERLIERLGIECSYEAVGNVSAAFTPGQLRRSERIAGFLAEAGGEIEFGIAEELGLPRTFEGGILERVGGVLNPGLLARGLRDALLASEARIFESTPVGAVDREAGGLLLRAPGGTLRAERVLLATNAFSRELPAAPRGAIKPLWVTLAETEPIEPERLDATGWSSRSGIYTQHLILESYRPTTRGTIVFGSRRVQPPRAALGARTPDPAVVADIARGFYERFPSLAEVEIRRSWGGWIAMTPSWLPVCGEAGSDIFYAVGFNGHGLAQAPYVGELMAEQIAGRVDREGEQLAPIWRKRSRFAPAPHLSGPALRAGWAIDRLTDRLAARRSGRAGGG